MGNSIGITGGIGSGKSIVTKILNTLGYPVFYSDQEAKTIMNSDLNVIKEIQAVFGQEAYKNKKLNKAYLAEQIFNNPELKLKINQIVHPKVRAKYSKLVEESNASFIFNEAAILFETGAYKNFDYTICVTAAKETRIKRVIKRDLINEKQVIARMNNQWPDEKKIKLADFTVSNNEGERILPQVFNILKTLEKRS